ncbi:MAG: type II CAAX endopeptidase family protein [Syntrophomonadaceae bacterium]|nr:type II CAAX endopeptidase family protein [Syntrophomonadaceae bacterium]
MEIKPRWGFIDVIVVYLAILGTSLIVQRLMLETGASEMQYFLTAFGVQFLATILFVYLLAVLFKQGKWSDLGLRPARLADLGIYGILGGILLIIMVLIMGLVLKYFQPDLQPQSIEELLRSASRLPDFLVLAAAATILAPISEEIFYRGMVYPLLRKYLGAAGGAVAAGMVFGLAHYDLWRALPLAVGGAALCYIYEKSGSILVSMAAHGVWNGIICILIYFSLSVGSI